MTEEVEVETERRSSTRAVCTLSVQYRREKDWHPATVMDLSSNGCRLRLGEDLPSSVPVSVRFQLPLKDGAATPWVDVAATVTWCRIEGLSRQAGLHFARSPAELEELLALLRSI